MAYQLKENNDNSENKRNKTTMVIAFIIAFVILVIAIVLSVFLPNFIKKKSNDNITYQKIFDTSLVDDTTSLTDGILTLTSENNVDDDVVHHLTLSFSTSNSNSMLDPTYSQYLYRSYGLASNDLKIKFTITDEDIELKSIVFAIYGGEFDTSTSLFDSSSYHQNNDEVVLFLDSDIYINKVTVTYTTA